MSGRVLPVGGIKEKVIAAVRNGVKEVIIPQRNEREVFNLPEELRKRVKIHMVSDISEIFNMVFED